ncbi:ParA family protein (plasmid) [Tundrisphaera lichenicola]|uniref:ParA family protein n=1 Tax=Tundrisphaera lichenicola TaxID=2029860 RepID=UPI003EB98A40
MRRRRARAGRADDRRRPARPGRGPRPGPGRCDSCRGLLKSSIEGDEPDRSRTRHNLAVLDPGRKKALLLASDSDAKPRVFQGQCPTEPGRTAGNNWAYPDEVIKQTGIPGIDLISGSRSLDDFNTPNPRSAEVEVQFYLQSFLSEVATFGKYDVAIIDCQSTLYLASWAALVASEHCVVPLSPEDYAAMGVADVQESIAMVQAGPNPGLSLTGYLLTKVGRKTIH